MDDSAANPVTVEQLSEALKETSTSDYSNDGNAVSTDDVKEEEDAEQNNDQFARKVFVGNIGYRQNWKDLKDFFGKFGKVLYTQVVFDHLRRRSKGFGFVEFATSQAADRCLMASPDELTLEGRKLRVNYAIESEKATFRMYPKVPDLLDTDGNSAENSDQYTDEQTGEDKSALLTVDEWKFIFRFLTLHEQVRLERVCQQWRNIALQLWKSRKVLVFKGFGFRNSLTDRILVSVLNRCSGSLQNLDFGSTSQVLSEYSMTIVGLRKRVLTQQEVAKPTKTNAERCKEYRENLKKNNPELFQVMHQHVVERNKRNRQKPKTPEQLEQQRRLTKLRVQKHRAKQKAESEKKEVDSPKSAPPPRITRAAAEKDDAARKSQRAKWVAEKRAQREKWNGNKWHWHRKKNLEAYHARMALQKSLNAGTQGHHCPGLVKLNMSGVQVTNIGLRDLSNATKQLKWINLRNCRHISEKGLWWLFKNCEQLEHIDFEDNIMVTGKCFFMVKPSLRCMIANGCVKLTDFGILELSKKCPHLRDLRISSSTLTNTAVRAVTTLSQLEVLHMGGKFPDATTEPWDLLGNLHELVELKLDLNPHITDKAVRAIAKGCPKLRTLDLSGCLPHVTEHGLLWLTALERLTSLDISYIKQVDDSILEQLSIRGLLERLVIRTCVEVTVTGVCRVLEWCPLLTWLDLSNNFSIWSSAVAGLNSHTCNRPPDLPLDIVIGGTAMVVEEEEGGIQLETTLPSWVTLHRRNGTDHQFNSHTGILLPDPLNFEEDKENLEEVAGMLVEGQNAEQGTGKGGSMLEESDKDGDRGDNEKQSASNCQEEVGGLEREEKMASKGLPYYEPLTIEEDLWELDPTNAQAWVPDSSVYRTPGMFEDDGLDDFDDDEFLDNDDPLEMERWQMS